VLPVIGEGALEAAEQFWAHTGERYEQRRHDVERPLLPPADLYLSPDELRNRLNQGERIELCGEGHPQRERSTALGSQPAPPVPIAAKDAVPAGGVEGLLGWSPGGGVWRARSAGGR